MASATRTALMRLAPIVLGLMAVAAFAMGILQQMQVNARHAALGQIYLAGPPPAVAIDRFSPGEDTGPLGEARLTAMLDLDAARHLGPLSKDGPTALAVPLRTGADAATSAGLAIFVMDDPARITAGMLRSVAGAEADAAPLLTLNGLIRPAGDWQGALATENLAAFAATGPVIFPFVEGRRAAILPPDYGQSTVVRHYSWIGGLLGVLALLAFASRVRGKRRSSGPGLEHAATDRPEDAATGTASAIAHRPEPIAVLTAGDGDDLPNVPDRRTPTRAILLGLAVTFIAAASILALPGLANRFGFAVSMSPGIGSWAVTRWQAAVSGDLRAILVLVLGAGAVIALAVKVAVDSLRRPAGAH